MKDDIYIILMGLVMCADPWPLNENSAYIIKKFLDDEAKRRGFDGWIEAYRELPHSSELEALDKLKGEE